MIKRFAVNIVWYLVILLNGPNSKHVLRFHHRRVAVLFSSMSTNRQSAWFEVDSFFSFSNQIESKQKNGDPIQLSFARRVPSTANLLQLSRISNFPKHFFFTCGPLNQVEDGCPGLQAAVDGHSRCGLDHRRTVAALHQEVVPQPERRWGRKVEIQKV